MQRNASSVCVFEIIPIQGYKGFAWWFELCSIVSENRPIRWLRTAGIMVHVVVNVRLKTMLMATLKRFAHVWAAGWDCDLDQYDPQPQNCQSHSTLAGEIRDQVRNMLKAYTSILLTSWFAMWFSLQCSPAVNLMPPILNFWLVNQCLWIFYCSYFCAGSNYTHDFCNAKSVSVENVSLLTKIANFGLIWTVQKPYTLKRLATKTHLSLVLISI